MSAGRAMRVIAWAASGVGIFIAFVWPFVVSSDPDSATLRAPPELKRAGAIPPRHQLVRR